MGKVRVPALKDVSLEIERGEFITIAGPSGSGKSTLLNLVGCLDRPTSGQVIINGQDICVVRDHDLDKIRSRFIGFIFQAFNLVPVLSVIENVELPLLIRPDISKSMRKEVVHHFVKEVGLDRFANRKPSELSGGQQQRVAVARALVTKPDIVLADEPTANLDSQTGIEIITLMHEINKKEKTTFVFSSHDPKVIDKADRVIRLKDGYLLPEGTT